MFGKAAHKVRSATFFPALLVLSSCFVIGFVAGRVAALRVPEDTIGGLREYLNDFIRLNPAETMTANTALSVFLTYFRYPVLAFLMGFTSIGLLLLPGLTGLFGFFLSFSICCFAAAYGQNGILLALLYMGLRCFLTLPCYLLTAIPAWRRSAKLASLSIGRGRRITVNRQEPPQWKLYGACCTVLFAGACAEILISPYLFECMQRLL